MQSLKIYLSYFRGRSMFQYKVLIVSFGIYTLYVIDIITVFYTGLSGDVVISSNHDRFPDITVYDMTSYGNFSVVAFLRFVLKNSFVDIVSTLH